MTFRHSVMGNPVQEPSGPGRPLFGSYLPGHGMVRPASPGARDPTIPGMWAGIRALSGRHGPPGALEGKGTWEART